MTKQVFSSFSLGSLQLKNRYIVAPMTRISADDDGTANETMAQYYERFAKGGFAMVISEGIYTDTLHSQGYLNQPGLATSEHVEAWKTVLRPVKENGAKMIAQLMHAGGQNQGNSYTETTIAPSDIAPKGEQLGFYHGSGPFKTPKAMDEKDIQQVIRSFAASAHNAQQAGFDGVEIHGANGYLLDEFLTEYLNKREDEFGPTIEKALTLFVKIIEAVREATSPDFTVGIRISQGKVSDQLYKWPNGEKDAELIFSTLGNTDLDYIHVTDKDGTAPTFGEGTKSLAQAAKTYSKGKPIIANGMLHDEEKAEKLIKDNHADLISIGTGALANPDLPLMIERGETLRPFQPQEILMPIAHIKEVELNQHILTK
ncbi:NADH:flavin oxidoreductase [Fictibacillus nanhaiensis]|uniref:NADH:flavin oxidoreductase n=1 Tax=Fictibacillus nanhaiensis TaxID=742169 RepID=UPI001C96581B|nr:NADH:flavin oxidoreductase [Fictibacillus nanhaiensis]MBY6036887.1 NADH:flavin oxidoreductase [Fictibacillus nanhaiensis]